jgi:hypothetical protein
MSLTNLEQDQSAYEDLPQAYFGQLGLGTGSGMGKKLIFGLAPSKTTTRMERFTVIPIIIIACGVCRD